MAPEAFQIRRATPDDADAIAAAHRDSIRAIGPRFYPPELVEDWGAGVTPRLYLRAMEEGEVFFIALGRVDGESAVLGFSSHHVHAAQDGISVYVRGEAARRGIGTALLRLAEAQALAHGATSIEIQASLAGVAFYAANGFDEIGPTEVTLSSGGRIPCVFMRKQLDALAA